MPCSSDGMDEYMERQRKDLADHLAQVLCSVMGQIEKDGRLQKAPAGARTWWSALKKADVARKAEELAEQNKVAAKRRALSKLSKDELEAIGML